MKKIITIAVLLLSQFANGQTLIKKVHGYFRTISPGIIRVQTDHNGNVIEQPSAAKKEYFIYVECSNTKKPSIISITLNGKKFDARLDSVLATPVIVTAEPASGTNRADTLVPKTSLSVWRVIPVAIAAKEKNTNNISVGLNKLTITYRPKNNGKVVTLSQQLSGIVPVAMP
jgi:hypothetical protein